MNGKTTPFPVRFAEKTQPVPLEGMYNDTLQRGTRWDEIGVATTTVETATGGTNDTDQDWDQD